MRSVRRSSQRWLQAQRLVHPLLIELKRQRSRPRDDLELVHEELDLAGGHLRVHGLGGARDDLSLGLQHEFVADLLRELGSRGGALRVDDELHEPGRVSKVDEDEPAVIAATSDPAGERRRSPDVPGS